MKLVLYGLPQQGGTSALATPLSPEELKALAEIAVWERNDFSMAIRHLRTLLFKSSFQTMGDTAKKRMAKAIWSCIIQRVAENSSRCLSAARRGSKQKRLAQAPSPKKLLAEALLMEHRNPTFRGFCDNAFKIVETDLAMDMTQCYSIGYCDATLDYYLDPDGPELTDEVLQKIEEALS
jgi:hypothetical protein